LTLEEVEMFASRDHTIVMSCELDLNMDYLVEAIWQYLKLVRVFTKRRGEAPSLDEPLILRQGTTISDVCDGIHRDMKDGFKYAMVWGTSAKHSPQRVGLNHLLQDEDVVEIHI
jgi:ribosome-interacting GTPase 1